MIDTMLPYEDVPELEEWLWQFLSSYGLNKPFIQAQCAKVERRNQLPTSSDLMVDIIEGVSGQTNLLMIRDIIEDYNYSMKKYMKKREPLENIPLRRHGISLEREELPSDRYREGISIKGSHYPYYQRYSYRRHSYQQPISPYQTLEQELESLERIATLIYFLSVA